MRFLYVTLTRMNRGAGDVVHISELLEELSCKPQETLKNVEVIDAGRTISRGVFTRIFTFIYLVLRVFYQVLRLRSRTDILYTRDALLGCWFTTFRCLFRLPVVFEVNGLRADESRMFFGPVAAWLVCMIGKWAEKTTARKANAVICVTEGIRDILRDEYGAPAERLTVVSNGVNLRLFTPNVDPKEHQKLRQKYNLTADDAVILYLGGLQAWQDKATEQLKLPAKRPTLLIVGDGKGREQFESEAKKIITQARVIFTGRVPYREAPLYISLANVCALPRTKEVNARIGLSPIKLFAYLACGKPIVATKIRGFEFLEESGLGSVVACRDDKAFAEALEEWLKNPQKQKEAGCRAQNYAEENCGWDRSAQEVFAVCRELAGARRKVKS